MLKRFYAVDSTGESVVLFVDGNSKAVFISATAFNEALTLDVAKRSDYSNFDGCNTAAEANANYADGSHLIDFNENDWDSIEEF